jgi:hypothetical protein
MEDLHCKLADPPEGVAALVQRECTEPGQDGRSWWVSVSDGSTAGRVKVSLSDSARVEAGEPEEEDIAPTVENVAARRWTEYGKLVKPMPDELTLRPDDFR